MPTDRGAPIYYIKALTGPRGGIRATDISDRVLSLQYEDEERRADKLTLTLRNDDFVITDDPLFKKGMKLEVQFGYVSSLRPAFEAVVTGVKGGRRVQVTAYANSVLMNTRRRSRTFENMTEADVVRTLFRENGWGDAELDVENTGAARETIVQGNLTDAQFIQRLAHRTGSIWYVDHTGAHFHPRRLGAAPVRTLTYFVDPGAGDIIDFDIDNDITGRPGRVRARGRNPLERFFLDETADDSTDAGRTTLAPVLEVIDPETGDARFERDIGNEETMPTSAPDAETARREATARFRRSQQIAVKLKVEIVGDPLMLARSIVDVRGMGQRLSQRYYVKKVTSKIEGRFVQTIEMVSDGHGGHATESRLARGLDAVEGPRTEAAVNSEPEVFERIDGETGAGRLETRTVPDTETGRPVTTFEETPRRRGGAT